MAVDGRLPKSRPSLTGESPHLLWFYSKKGANNGDCEFTHNHTHARARGQVEVRHSIVAAPTVVLGEAYVFVGTAESAGATPLPLLGQLHEDEMRNSSPARFSRVESPEHTGFLLDRVAGERATTF